MKELGRSKWSNDADEDDTERTEGVKTSALSGLIQAYGKKVKSVRWADQVFYSLCYYFVHFKGNMIVHVFIFMTF